MAEPSTFSKRFLNVLLPTPPQAIGALLISLSLLAITQSRALLAQVGLTDAALSATQNHFSERLSLILHSTLASQIALVTLWSSIGLIAYLICWGGYNLFIEIRNRITIQTQYTNNTNPKEATLHWRGPIETFALKSFSGLCLLSLISLLLPGFSLWNTLVARSIAQLSLSNTAGGFVALLGFAVHLYLILACIQLTFTPWYKNQPFTSE